MGVFVSENDLIISQAIPSKPSVPKPRPAVIVGCQGVCSSFSIRRVLLISWWRLSKLAHHISVGSQLSHHIIDSAQLVFASVEINLPSLLSFLTFDCHCHSILAPSNSPEMSVNACLAFEESTRPRVNPRDMELGREPRLPPFGQTGSLSVETIVA